MTAALPKELSDNEDAKRKKKNRRAPYSLFQTSQEGETGASEWEMTVVCFLLLSIAFFSRKMLTDYLGNEAASLAKTDPIQ